MKKNEYEELLVKMFIIENLGEHLYKTLGSKCKDTNLKSIYQKLELNEKETRDCIEKELTSIDIPLPVFKARCITNIARLFFKALSRKRLHKFLTRILSRRIYSNWHEKYCDRNADFWTQLLEHENLQHQMLTIPEQ